MVSRSLARFLFLAAGLPLLACASDDAIPVSSSHDPLYRFPAQASYAWDDDASSMPDSPGIDRETTEALFKQVAEDAFAARGYRASASPGADYRLSYQYVINTRTGPDESIAVGSLSLMLAERATRRRIWSGFGQAEIYLGLSPEERRARLRDAMDRMLQFFPPSQRPPE